MSFLHSFRRFCTPATINNVAVIGSGQMGVGIAICAAFVANKKVLLIDNNEQMLTDGTKTIHKWLTKQQAKGSLSSSFANTSPDELISNSIETSTDMNSINNHQFVIEAVSEIESLKQSIFSKLNEITSATTILASNTSSIPISRLASFVDDQRRAYVCGMHFMNPVPVMKLVEIIPSLSTSDETMASVKQFAAEMEKTCTVSSDSTGFVANRILMPYINEAVFCLQEGIATRDDIDTTMKLGTNVPMGPLTLADFIGIDTTLYIMQTMHSQFGDSKYRPAPLLQRMVECGWLGRKSGKGFYEYRKK